MVLAVMIPIWLMLARCGGGGRTPHQAYRYRQYRRRVYGDF